MFVFLVAIGSFWLSGQKLLVYTLWFVTWRFCCKLYKVWLTGVYICGLSLLFFAFFDGPGS